MLHVVWGLGSLEREAQETIASRLNLSTNGFAIHNNYEDAKFTLESEIEYDETYLFHLQKYFKIDELHLANENHL